MGSVVIGAGLNDAEPAAGPVGALEGDAEKTLQDARFVIGDYVSCAILPPLANGEVAAPPTRNPRPEFGNRAPPPPRENGFGGFGGGPRRGGRYEGGRGSSVPSGEWRRGDVPPGGLAGGYGRGGGGRSRGW
jgi:histone deacetylase complex subunit SAP18